MSSLDVNTAKVFEREAIRDQLEMCREEMDVAIFEATATGSFTAVVKAVELQGEIMDLLRYFISIGGKVLAAPLYQINCMGGGCFEPRINMRKKAITQLVLHNVPAVLAYQIPGYQTLAVKDRKGNTRVLRRLLGGVGEPGEDTRIWKWLFADLKEDETLESVINMKSRWAWAGKFGLGHEIERGVSDFADGGVIQGMIRLE